ncbi:neutral zinc metallopeptidase [Planococcus chinensis]|uniref:Neutral zinc metallopeptidase n=1 Tax=Planococcus chinensis TaxID=272917 RepID=A0ABW4QES8_9BACL
MLRKTSQILLAMVVFLLIPEWNTLQPPTQAAENQETVVLQPAALAAKEAAPVSQAFTKGLPKGYSMHDFLVYVLADVEAFWSPLMVKDGYAKPDAGYSFPAAGKPVLTECILDTPDEPALAFYCSTDDRIVMTLQMATQLKEGTYKTNAEPPSKYKPGDFSVAFVLAHEYAHNLQTERGWLPENGDEAPKATSRSLELNADCMTGVWVHSVNARRLLDATDIQEVKRTLADIGQDPSVTDPTHGTPKERTKAFLLGYDSGKAASCEPYLTTRY